MKYKITTDYASLMLEVKVKAVKPEKLYLVVYDAKNPNLKFTNRYKTITGEQSLYVRMPLSPEVAVVEVYGTSGQNIKRDDEVKNFDIVSVTKKPLVRRIDVNDIASPQIRSFVEFAQRLCFNLDTTVVGKTYSSKDGNTFIKVSDKIRNQAGVVMNTPARIGRKTGMIEISKSLFEPMTFPMRMAILTHEYSHFFLNEKIDDEMEADLNGLLIYLGLGYPRIEAVEVFAKTFEGAPTELNGERMKFMMKFIHEFDNMNIVLEG